MITIQNLEVRFEVEGDDRQRFAALFNEFMRRWSTEAEERRRGERQAARDRSLGDQFNNGSDY